MKTTRIKLIEAAEREFAQRGFHGASIREITSRAGANVASVNYHFSSKEGLFIAMIRHRIEPINELRLQLLQTALDENGGLPLPIERLVFIMIRPLVESFHAGTGRRDFLRAMERCLTEEEKFAASLYKDALGDIIKVFRRELGRSLAPADNELVNHCFHYIASCMSGTFLYHPKHIGSKAQRSFPDADYLCAFIVGGINNLVGSQSNN